MIGKKKKKLRKQTGKSDCEGDRKQQRGVDERELLPKDRGNTDSYKLSFVLTGGCEWFMHLYHRLVLAAGMWPVSHCGTNTLKQNHNITRTWSRMGQRVCLANDYFKNRVVFSFN